MRRVPRQRPHPHIELRLPALFEGRGRQYEQAAAFLGTDDPLVRVLNRLDVLVAQSCTAAAAVVAGAAALVAGASWGRAALIAAGIVQLALAAGIGVLMLSRNERARALIIDDCESLPVPAIQHERIRLLSRRRRLGLARSVEHLLETAEQWARAPHLGRPATRPLFNVPVVLTHAKELERVAVLLRLDPGSARGVALVDRLLTSPGSPLYENLFSTHEQRDALFAEELQRIKAALLPSDGPTRTTAGQHDAGHA